MAKISYSDVVSKATRPDYERSNRQAEFGGVHMPASCALSLPFSFVEVLILPLDSVLGIQPCPQSYNSWDYSKLDPERFRREKLCRRKTLINSKASLMASAPSALATPSHHLVEVRKGLDVEILRPAPVSCMPSARSYYFQHRAGI